MHTVALLKHFVENHEILAYLLIFLGLIFEGEFVLVMTGVLAHLGAISFWVALIFIICGGISKTFLGYYTGQFIHNKWNNSKFLMHIEKRVLYFIPRFKERPFWSIFISKFIMGVNYLVVIFSGYMKIDLRTYLKAEIISTLVWAPALLSLGYFFSYTAFHVSREISRFSLIVLILFLAFMILNKFIAYLYELSTEFENGK